jgi:predicted pyridoxine 5'-phosphate oxidase superfamily flavin-nucleotide-binding protein
MIQETPLPALVSRDIAFTPAVKAEQARRGSDRVYAEGGFRGRVTADLAAFLAERDSFYLGSASGDGRPYIQHRGGPKGFLKVLGPTLLGFADFAGNRQYITLGNLAENDRVFLFLMDYANRARIKLWGRARVVEGDAALMEALALPGYRARPERAILIEVEAWDVNCRQHIQPRYDEATVARVVEKLTSRIAELEAEVAQLKGLD